MSVLLHAFVMSPYFNVYRTQPQRSFMSLARHENLQAWKQNYNIDNHKNYNFLECDWSKNSYFPTNSLAKLLSDSLLLDRLLLDSLLLDGLLSDSSMSQSRSKFYFKLTNRIQSCNYLRACARLLLCFWRLIAGRRCNDLKMLTSPL